MNGGGGESGRSRDAVKTLCYLPSDIFPVSKDVVVPRKWELPFLESHTAIPQKQLALIVNQPFTLGLLWRLWKTSSWRACADGGANLLHDSFSGELKGLRDKYVFLPSLRHSSVDSS